MTAKKNLAESMKRFNFFEGVVSNPSEGGVQGTLPCIQVIAAGMRVVGFLGNKDSVVSPLI
jgi:hypothetical protein